MEKLNNRSTFILALELEEKKKELLNNNILIKNNSFSLNDLQKSVIEEKYNYTFNKKYFNTKNTFLYSKIKEALEAKNYTFKSVKELEEELKEFKEKRIKELKEEEKEEAKNNEKTN